MDVLLAFDYELPLVEISYYNSSRKGRKEGREREGGRKGGGREGGEKREGGRKKQQIDIQSQELRHSSSTLYIERVFRLPISKSLLIRAS